MKFEDKYYLTLPRNSIEVDHFYDLAQILIAYEKSVFVEQLFPECLSPGMAELSSREYNYFFLKFHEITVMNTSETIWPEYYFDLFRHLLRYCFTIENFETIARKSVYEASNCLTTFKKLLSKCTYDDIETVYNSVIRGIDGRPLFLVSLSTLSYSLLYDRYIAFAKQVANSDKNCFAPVNYNKLIEIIFEEAKVANRLYFIDIFGCTDQLSMRAASTFTSIIYSSQERLSMLFDWDYEIYRVIVDKIIPNLSTNFDKYYVPNGCRGLVQKNNHFLRLLVSDKCKEGGFATGSIIKKLDKSKLLWEFIKSNNEVAGPFTTPKMLQFLHDGELFGVQYLRHTGIPMFLSVDMFMVPFNMKEVLLGTRCMNYLSFCNCFTYNCSNYYSIFFYENIFIECCGFDVLISFYRAVKNKIDSLISEAEILKLLDREKADEVRRSFKKKQLKTPVALNIVDDTVESSAKTCTSGDFLVNSDNQTHNEFFKNNEHTCRCYDKNNCQDNNDSANTESSPCMLGCNAQPDPFTDWLYVLLSLIYQKNGLADNSVAKRFLHRAYPIFLQQCYDLRRFNSFRESFNKRFGNSEVELTNRVNLFCILCQENNLDFDLSTDNDINDPFINELIVACLNLSNQEVQQALYLIAPENNFDALCPISISSISKNLNNAGQQIDLSSVLHKVTPLEFVSSTTSYLSYKPQKEKYCYFGVEHTLRKRIQACVLQKLNESRITFENLSNIASVVNDPASKLCGELFSSNNSVNDSASLQQFMTHPTPTADHYAKDDDDCRITESLLNTTDSSKILQPSSKPARQDQAKPSTDNSYSDDETQKLAAIAKESISNILKVCGYDHNSGDRVTSSCVNKSSNHKTCQTTCDVSTNNHSSAKAVVNPASADANLSNDIIESKKVNCSSPIDKAANEFYKLRDVSLTKSKKQNKKEKKLQTYLALELSVRPKTIVYEDKASKTIKLLSRKKSDTDNNKPVESTKPSPFSESIKADTVMKKTDVTNQTATTAKPALTVTNAKVAKKPSVEPVTKTQLNYLNNATIRYNATDHINCLSSDKSLDLEEQTHVPQKLVTYSDPIHRTSRSWTDLASNLRSSMKKTVTAPAKSLKSFKDGYVGYSLLKSSDAPNLESLADSTNK